MPGSVSPWVDFMLLWLTVTLLVVTPARGQYGTAPKSVISLQPPWTTFFEGENVTLACYRYGFYSPQKTKWYQREKTPWESQEYTLTVHESGEYWCQADSLPPSSHVHLNFSKDPLVLQAPPAVFEGDSVVLKCLAKEGIGTLKLIKDRKPLKFSHQNLEFHIQHANLRDSGDYYCTRKEAWYWRTASTSNIVRVQVQELFPRPVLTVRPSKPIDGSPVTLTCQTQLPAQRSNAQLQFCFFRNVRPLGLNCSSSPEFRIPAIWTEESKWYYRCKAKTVSSQTGKQSMVAKIPVQRAFADFQIHIVPASKLVFEGQLLLFNCTVKGVPGPLKFSWYKRDNLNKERKIRKSSEAEFKISSVNSTDAGDYYCEANNSRRSFVSGAVPITIKVPVSLPVLTLSSGQTQALEGDLMTLHCKSERGSPYILYEFYYEDVSLGTNSTLSGGGATFNFSMTTEHSGNYYCTADNGLGARRSEAVRLTVIVPVSRPVLTLRGSGAQAVVGDVVELYCETLKGSPPILYHFYHQNVTLGSISSPDGRRGSFNFSVTVEHFGNFFCEADNGHGPQRSDTVTLSIIDVTKNRSVAVASGITGGLATMAAGVLLLYCWFSRKSGGKPAFDDSRSPSESEPHEPTYYNVPVSLELQPVHSNDPKEDVIYTEVWSTHQRHNDAASELGVPTNTESLAIYSQVKLPSTPAPTHQKSVSSAPHR